MDIRPEKFISGEGFDYRITLADGLSGYALMLVIAFLSYPLFDDQISHFLSKIISGEIDVWLIAVALLILVPLSIPVGLVLNVMSFTLTPIVRIFKYRIIHKFLSKFLLCGDINPYFCQIIPPTIKPQEFYEVLSLIMCIHRHAKDKGLMRSSVRMADRTVGFYIFLRSLSFVMLAFSVIYIRPHHFLAILLLTISVIFLFLASLTDYYTLTHILRGLYGNYVVRYKRLPKFTYNPTENALLLLQALDS